MNDIDDDLKTYLFAWTGRKRFIDARSKQSAKSKFMERFGFHPDEVEGLLILAENRRGAFA